MFREGTIMKRVTLLLVGVATLAGIVVFTTTTSRNVRAQAAAPIFGIKIPDGYRDWRFISVAHEAGELNDIRTIIAALHYKFVPSAENNKAFGRDQSFVVGAPTNNQFMIKDSKKYAATGGWGFGHFNNDGKKVDDAFMKTCFPCHEKVKKRDLVFTRYAP
jgi:hypothetical protein